MPRPGRRAVTSVATCPAPAVGVERPENGIDFARRQTNLTQDGDATDRRMPVSARCRPSTASTTRQSLS